MTTETSLSALSEADLVALTRRAWGAYMYEECAERGYNAAKSRLHFNEYCEFSKECERRGIHPFIGTPHPRDAWPADWYRKAKEGGLISEA